MDRSDPTSPIRVFLLILGVAFATEAGIMLVFAILGVRADNLWASFLDAAVLVALLCPVLWIFVVRPLRELSAERGALLERTLAAQEEERVRLARDVHDELGQTQTAILFGLRAVETASTLEEARERAGEVRGMAATAIDTTRRLARGLSPAVLHDLGLGPAIERVCEDMAAGTPIPIERAIDLGSRRFDHAVEIAAYRVVQEAITNALKHSGARRIVVRAGAAEDSTLELSIEDDGRGVTNGDVAARTGAGRGRLGGLGLTGMRERVTLLGGRFRLESSPHTGTIVRASFPPRAPGAQSPRPATSLGGQGSS